MPFEHTVHITNGGLIISVGLKVVGGDTGFNVGGVTTTSSSLIVGVTVGEKVGSLGTGTGGGGTSGSTVGASVALLNVGKGVAGTGPPPS